MQLNEHNVEYMIIGGTAVAFHGFSRPSMGMGGAIIDKYDIDIWYNPVITNYYNLLKAIKTTGKNVDSLFDEVADPKKSFLKFDYGEYNVDYNPTILGFDSFYPVYKRVKIVGIENIEIPIINYEDLIHSKESLSRNTKNDLDKKDIEELKKKNKGNRDSE